MDPRHARRYYRQELVEHQFWWQTKMGNTHFWFDNWTGLGELYYATSGDYFDESIQKFMR